METSHDIGGSSNTSFIWTDDLAKQMVELLLDFRKKTNSNGPFKWDELTLEFGKKIGRQCTKVVMKNKHATLKREYSAWKMLRTRETGLGWDPVKRRIIADKQWWDKKITEKKECSKFRHKGMEAEWEELLDRLFGGTIATGRLAMSPSMNPTRLPGRSNVEVVVDSIGNEEMDINDRNFSDGRDNFFHNFTSILSGEGVQPHVDSLGTQTAPHCCPNQEEGMTQGHTPITSPVTGTPPAAAPTSSTGRPESSKRRKSVGVALLSSHLSQSQYRSERMLQLFEGEASSIAQAAATLPPPIVAGIDMLNRMATAGVVEDRGPLWCYALIRNMDDKWRQTILTLDSHEQRLAFMQFDYDMHKSASV